MATARSTEIHRALGDETRMRLYRYIGLAGRPLSVREMSHRLQLHPNSVRAHLNRLEEAGLVAREPGRRSAVGRPQILYSAVARPEEGEGEYRLLAEMLCGLVGGRRSMDRALGTARRWGSYLVAKDRPRPAASRQPGLAAVQEAMSRAGFDPRFRRLPDGSVEITLRRCPFQDLAEDYGELVCTLHRGLIEGILAGLDPPLRVEEFEPSGPRGSCRVRAG